MTGLHGDAASLDDLDHLFDTVKHEKGKIDVFFDSARKGKPTVLGEIAERAFRQ